MAAQHTLRDNKSGKFRKKCTPRMYPCHGLSFKFKNETINSMIKHFHHIHFENKQLFQSMISHLNSSQTTSIFCTFWCCFPLFLPSKSGSFIAFLITLFINIIRFTKIYIITATQILSKTHFLCLR
eukprot:19061_1